MSDPNDNSIPVLHEILVPGRVPQAREGTADAPAAQPAPEQSDMPREPGFRAEPALAPQPVQANEPGLTPEPALAPQPVLAPEQTRAPEPVLAPEPAHAAEPAFTPASLAASQAAHPAEPVLEPQPQALHTVEHAHPKRRLRLHHGTEREDHGHVSPGVFDRAEPGAPLEAGTIVPPDIAHETAVAAPPQQDLDADAIAERLRGRFAGFLTGEGRGIIEARCHDALQEHTTLLVSQITREVALTLETEMAGWVREAVEEEITRRAGRG
ncbi:uncharacterized protein DUF2486 [Paraburkholderia sp. RAU2J]|uniref:DUF2486 family protein n=1 Tax=Paraburkholderia sp. RAU2J TaxID=1938810 RepID=UPI000EAD1A73|nr:DUF2486 family protein [Paraburkholderia sp. RAU2J]RKT26313.1 uncharacterized protein DUF2486 [Paraburkholderia sp. RAU2J]